MFGAADGEDSRRPREAEWGGRLVRSPFTEKKTEIWRDDCHVQGHIVKGHLSGPGSCFQALSASGLPIFILSVHFAATHVKSEMGGSECVCGAAERRAAAAGFLVGS